MNTSPAMAVPVSRVIKPRFFYIASALLLFALVFLGFQLFYLHGRAYPGRPLTPPIRTLVIAHGVAMSAWILLFIVQTVLIEARRHRVHRALGMAGAALAALIVVLGARVAVAAAAVNPPQVVLWGLVPHQFMAVSLCGILLFGGFVAVGVANRRRPAVHRPMMLLGTLAACAAAIDRIGFISHPISQFSLGRFFGPFFAPVAIAGALFLVKWAMTRTVNRAYAVGLAVLALSGPITMKLATTPAWAAFADYLTR